MRCCWTVTGMQTAWLLVACVGWVQAARAEVWDRRKEPFFKAPLAEVQKAAEAGDPLAQKRLGDLYSDGTGVASNPAEAVRWYRLAAVQGLAPAQHNLGNAFFTGQGAPKNPVEGARWYHLAAKQNLAQAQYALGFCYLAGEGIPPNYNEGIRLITLAAEQGMPEAQYTLGDLFTTRPPVPDHELAFRWYRKAAAQNLVYAQVALAACYENGRGVKPDPAQAFKWYEKAAGQGSLPARKRAALMLYENKGLKPNYREAEKRLLALAREQPDDVDVQFALGFIYYNGGFGVKRATAKAAPWYHAAAQRGYAFAQHNLALQLECGEGIPQDFTTAYAWYLLAAAQGIQDSLQRLGNLQRSMSSAQISQAERIAAGFQPVQTATSAPSLMIQNLQIDPPIMSPGALYAFTLHFTLALPQSPPQIPVEVGFRILQGTRVLYESQAVRIMANNGGTTTFTKRDLPCNAPPGIYELQTIVRNGQSQTDKTVQFTVK